jgi:hypothetical protein
MWRSVLRFAQNVLIVGTDVLDVLVVGALEVGEALGARDLAVLEA